MVPSVRSKRLCDPSPRLTFLLSVRSLSAPSITQLVLDPRAILFPTPSSDPSPPRDPFFPALLPLRAVNHAPTLLPPRDPSFDKRWKAPNPNLRCKSHRVPLSPSPTSRTLPHAWHTWPSSAITIAHHPHPCPRTNPAATRARFWFWSKNSIPATIYAFSCVFFNPNPPLCSPKMSTMESKAVALARKKKGTTVTTIAITSSSHHHAAIAPIPIG